MLPRFGIKTILITTLILMIPLVAMQFTTEVNWSAFDFLVAGLLLLIPGFTYEWVSRRDLDPGQRRGLALGLAGMVLLVWLNLAVGIIGAESNPANRLYLLVIIVIVLGSLLSGLKARAMKQVMLVAASLQALIGLIAVILGWGREGAIWPWSIVGLTAIFVLLWLATGFLFQTSRSP